MNFYNQEKQKVLDYFEVSFNGLKSKKVIENREKYGRNELVEKTSKTKIQVFFEQFKDLLVIILIIAAIISMITNELESTIVIFIVIILNALLGTYQHFKAEKSLESLKSLTSSTVRVIRNGSEETIPNKDLVVGDIVEIKAGDVVSADGRIIYSQTLEVNESSLTGESQAVEKNDNVLNFENIAISDQSNMVFSGSTVSAGKALFVITKVGMNTELGHIAKMLDNSKYHKTPLQTSLDEFSKKLAIIIIIICIVVFGLSVYRNVSLLDSLLFSVALAVAAIPEALSSIVTIVLAIGTQRMAEENAIIKDLKAVEGLGCINVICSDKTGTITQNKMEVHKLYCNNTVVDPTSFKTNNKLNQYFMLTCLLCNDSVLTNFQSANFTEIALVNFAKKIGMDVFTESQKYPRISEVAFDSKRKLMSTLHKVSDQLIMFSKGGGDVVLSKSTYIYINDKVRKLTTGDRYDINIHTKQFANAGYRTIGLAYKEIKPENENDLVISANDEDDLIFLGIVALIDPPRVEAKNAISEAIKAGIRPVMITGDHANTAIAISKSVGIFSDKDLYMTGSDLNKISDNELDEKISKISVYARVSPEHKIRIVKAWQRKQGIVAFVGDGINDAPAIRQANIGISMGNSGTEVSKDASSIILTDDNYYTIIKAVRNGRKVYNNIQNAITFLLSGNAAGILIVLLTSILKLPLPFAPVHLLFINLLTDSLPAIAIGMEESDEDLLSKPPRDPKQSLLSKRVIKIIVFEGILIAIFTTFSYLVGLSTDQFTARTCVFGTLCMARLFHSFNCRGTKSIFLNKVKNRAMLYSFFGGMILINLVLFVPELHSIFHTYSLTSNQILVMYLCAIMPTLILQIILLMRYMKRQKTHKKKV